jgi:hypothetical protein
LSSNSQARSLQAGSSGSSGGGGGSSTGSSGVRVGRDLALDHHHRVDLVGYMVGNGVTDDQVDGDSLVSAAWRSAGGGRGLEGRSLVAPGRMCDFWGRPVADWCGMRSGLSGARGLVGRLGIQAVDQDSCSCLHGRASAERQPR